MLMILQACVILSGLIEVVLGIWFAVGGRDHSPLRWLFDLGASSAGPATSATLIGFFFALICFLAAALHFLMWRWLREDRDEAYALINLYGGFAFLSGLSLFAAFVNGRGAGPLAAAPWIPAALVLDSVRGAALVVVARIARHAPMTVRELRLPARAAAGTPRPAMARTESRARGADEAPGRHDRRRGGRERGGARAPMESMRARPGAAPAASALPPRQPAPAASALPPRRPAPAVPTLPVDAGELDDRSRHRTRGRRGGRRGRVVREDEGATRPAPAAETAVSAAPVRGPGNEPVARPLQGVATRPPERDRARDDLRSEERARDRRPREERAREGRPREGRERRESLHGESERETRPRESDQRDDRVREERPRHLERPPGRSFAAVRPPSVRMTETRRAVEGETDEAGAPSSAERGEFEGGRRPKRGRYSTGALFRPREKRAHRPLGGAATSQWAWPAPEPPTSAAAPEARPPANAPDAEPEP